MFPSVGAALRPPHFRRPWRPGAQAIALSFKVENAAVVHEPVDQRAGERVITTEHFAPVGICRHRRSFQMWASFIAPLFAT